METHFTRAHEELGQQRQTETCTAGLLHPTLVDYLMVILMAGPTIGSEAHSASLLVSGTEKSQHTGLRKPCPMKCCMQGVSVFSGCISTEELWMATNCSYYANETAHLKLPMWLL